MAFSKLQEAASLPEKEKQPFFNVVLKFERKKEDRWKNVIRLQELQKQTGLSIPEICFELIDEALNQLEPEPAPAKVETTGKLSPKLKG